MCKEIDMWSDACWAQNKNIKMALMMTHYLMNSELKSIIQHFYLSGHSYNVCDRMFGIIEKKNERHQIFMCQVSGVI